MSRCFKSKYTKDEFNSTNNKCLAFNVKKKTLSEGDENGNKNFQDNYLS